MLHDRPLRSSIDPCRARLGPTSHSRTTTVVVGPPGFPWCRSPPSAITSPKAPSPSTRAASSRTSTASPPRCSASAPMRSSAATCSPSPGPRSATHRRSSRVRSPRCWSAASSTCYRSTTPTPRPSFNVDYCRLFPIADGGALILLGETMSPSVSERLSRARSTRRDPAAHQPVARGRARPAAARDPRGRADWRKRRRPSAARRAVSSIAAAGAGSETVVVGRWAESRIESFAAEVVRSQRAAPHRRSRAPRSAARDQPWSRRRARSHWRASRRHCRSPTGRSARSW